MHVLINAIPISPGGGLTVVRGLIDGLAEARPGWRVTALTCVGTTHHWLSSSANPRCTVRRIAAAPGLSAAWWQARRLGAEAAALHADTVVSINHLVPGVERPQVVYHLNLRRFQKSYRSWSPRSFIAEWLRDAAAFGALRKASGNVFESSFLHGAARARLGSEPVSASVVSIGLADVWKQRVPERRPPAGRVLRLATVTSPQPHKDNPTLLRTLAELDRQLPEREVHLDVVGGASPDAWAAERRLAETLGVAGRVHWRGFCEPSRTAEVLDAADVFLLTSQMESFAMTALEAMTRGVPTVVANCAAMPETVGAAGLLAEPGSAASFASQVARLARDAGLWSRLSAEGRRRAARFTWPACAEAFAAVVERGCGAGGSGLRAA